MKKIQQGFTLIELIVVIGIIAVLTGLITFNFNSARARARDIQRKNDLKAIQNALEIYRADNGQAFPNSGSFGGVWGTTLNSGLMAVLYGAGTGSISKVFSDPRETMKAGSWRQYTYAGGGLTYTMTACLENRSDQDVATGAACGPSNQGKTYTVTNP